jgi:hypothetical protein
MEVDDMGVRNCGELGVNLQKIVRRLMANDELVSLLYFEDKDPTNHLPLTTDEKQELIFEELIRVTPKVNTREDSKSVIAVYVTKGSKISSNKEFTNISISVDVFVPLTQWIIKDTNLRPFAILGQIQESLDGKTINGLGQLSGGDFDLVLLTDEMSVYRQTYSLTEYA